MKLVFPGNPISTNQLYRRHGYILYMSDEGRQMKQMYQWEAKNAWRGYKRLTGAVKVSIKLYFKDNRVRDIDNYNKILLDALTGIAWEDDKQINKIEIEKSIDKANPRAEIEIYDNSQDKIDVVQGQKLLRPKKLRSRKSPK